MIELTPSQRRAVESDSQEILCIAGAGSGKTRVLVERIVHLLANGYHESEIMALTFTRRAAEEVRNRLAERTGKVPRMMLGTFHAVSLKIIQQDAKRLGYRNEALTIVPPKDAADLLRQTVIDLGYLAGKAWRKGLSGERLEKALGTYYSTGRLPLWRDGEHTRRIIREYHARLRQLNALDYGMILLEAKRLLDELPDVRAAWNKRIRAVLVDELQDTDEVQFDLHERFCPPASFFGVGDPRQTIYRWRGARPDLMTERHPQAEVVELSENFRSGSEVVEASNRLIGHNPEQYAPMLCATGRNAHTWRFTGRSANVAELVNSLLVNHKPQDVAILARAHRHLIRLETVLQEAGVPAYRVGRRFGICSSDEFRLCLACMRLIVNPHYNPAFALLAKAAGLTTEQYAACRYQAADASCGEYAAALDSETVGPLLSAALGDWALESCGTAAQFAQKLSGTLLSASPLRLRIIEFWEAFAPGCSVRSALKRWDLKDSQEDLDVGERVTLLTCHAAKGLEWPVVILAEMMEGSFPTTQSLRDGIQDERRLAYVAMTRARDHLVLHFREVQDQAANRPISKPSRFIGEAYGDEDKQGVRRDRADKGCRDVRSDRSGGQPGADGETSPGADGERRPEPDGTEAAAEVRGAGNEAGDAA